jgi:hypothetical protein
VVAARLFIDSHHARRQAYRHPASPPGRRPAATNPVLAYRQRCAKSRSDTRSYIDFGRRICGSSVCLGKVHAAGRAIGACLRCIKETDGFRCGSPNLRIPLRTLRRCR